MKYTLIFIAALSLVSCSKKKCYTCVTTFSYEPYASYRVYKPDTAKYCDKTQKQIDEVAKVGTFTSTGVDAQGVTTKSITTTTCN
jgi:hypothetical protein